MDWLRDWLWLGWIGVAVAAGVVEVLTLDFIFVMIAGAALVAGLAAFLTGSVPASILVFAISSVLLLFVARPPLLHYMRRSAPASSMGVAALVGRTAKVVDEVTADSGTVKLAGEIWTARTQDGHVLEPGSSVSVLRIEGAIAVVTAVRELPS